MKISVSYLKSIYDKKKTIEEIEKTSADFIHVDLMDGKFVEKNNIDMQDLQKLLKDCQKPLDIHLMTNEFETYLSELEALHPKYLTIHLEAPFDTDKSIDMIKKRGIKVGLAIKPNTSVEHIVPYLQKIDLLLVMSVEPGLGGQKFLPSTITKLQDLKKYQAIHPFLINVDGGINDTTIQDIKPYVDMVVSGSFICEQKCYETQIKKLR